MSDPRFDNFSKYDILVEVKTLCRKAKTTTWAELIETWFKTGDAKWNPEDYELKTSGVGHARMGLMASYMTDVNRHLDPTFGKAILPAMDGLANGLGHIVLVGYKEGETTPNPLLTVLFEFSQKPGEEIKVSKNMQAYEERRKELEAIEKQALFMVRELFHGIEAYKAEHKGTPLLIYTSDEEVPEMLRGRRFSPYLRRWETPSAELKPSIVLSFREHTTEPEGVCPPLLFDLIAEEGDEGLLWIRYEGSDDPTPDQLLLVKEILHAFNDILGGKEEPSIRTVSQVTY